MPPTIKDAEAYVVEVLDAWERMGGMPSDLLTALENIIADIWGEVQSK